MFGNQAVAVIIPALDEAQNITAIIQSIKSLDDNNQASLVDEIIVCDNGSQDNTGELAQIAGARVVNEPKRGYGAACLKGIKSLNTLETKPDILIFIDGDQSIDCNQIIELLNPISEGADLVIGSRQPECRERGALSLPQQFGNYLAAWLIRQIWNTYVTDLGPFRAIRYDKLEQLQMQDQAFGWTVEMQVKAIIQKLNVVEVPVRCLRRQGKSKISGTIKGVWGAGCGILGTIFSLWFKSRFSS